MRTKILILFLLCLLGSSGFVFSQPQHGTGWVNNGTCDYSRLRQMGLPGNWSRSLGVFQTNTVPIALLEVNSNPGHYPFPSCNFPLSDVFTTDAGHLMSNWSMRQFGTEYGRIYSDNADFHILSTNAKLWLHTDQLGTNTPRILVDDDATNGSVLMSNNAGITPTSRLHIHMTTASPSDLKFSNLSTGPLAGDGFRIGVNTAGDNAGVFMLEDGELSFGTTNIRRGFFDDGATTTGSFAIGDNLAAGFIPQSRLHIHMTTLSPSDMRFTNLATGPFFGDGLRIGVTPTADAGVMLLENGTLSLGTTNIPHLKIDNSGSTGSVLISDNAIATPASRLHVHTTTATPSDIRVTNASTGATFGDGLRIGVTPAGTDAGIVMVEVGALNLGTSNIPRIRTISNGRTIFGLNVTGGVPTNRVVIDADVTDPTPSGLQFVDLTCVGPTVANPGPGVLSVDCAGNVIYVPGGAPGTITGAVNGCSVAGTDVVWGGNIGSGLGALTNDREIFMNSNSAMFNITPASAASIGLGYPSGTPAISNKARLDVFNDYNLYFSAGDFTTNMSNTSELFGSRGIATNLGTGDATGVLGIGGGTAAASAISTGVKGSSVGTSDKNFGIHGEANNGTVESTAGLFEVLSSGSTTNTGVKGEVSFTTNTLATNVAGDFIVSTNFGTGSVAVRGTCTTATGGAGPDWAGQFLGDLYGSGTFQPSDRNLKRDINPIENSLEIIQRLKPVNYFFDTEKNANMGLATTKQWGFISQEVQEILPELTKQTTIAPVYDSKGKEIVKQTDVLTLNYNGFIAILTDAIQEQQKQIDELKQMIGMMQQTNDAVNPNINTQDVELSDKEYVVLNQNVPNPFAEQTTISYVIPQTASNAQIIFYDALGRMIKNVVINDKGEGRLNVYADDLSSGVYSYSLFVDGKLIDTKKMVKN